MFFNAFPRFYETSETSAMRGRLNLRYEAIFAQNADVYGGATVLDIASHDGRWSLAALHSGAEEVVGIEARSELVAAARDNLDRYARGQRYDFIIGDVFDVFAERALKADVVLCLGFLYHTIRYNELMRGICDTGARHLILDTQVDAHARRRVVHLRRERTDEQQSAAADRFSRGGRTLVGRPSLSALKLILLTYGFEIERFSDWGALLRDNPQLGGVKGYRQGRRLTARCVSTG
jgi:hypothetical protein